MEPQQALTAFQAVANAGQYVNDLRAQPFNNSQRAWATQTAYNTPLQQRLRLEEAGLNPALMYGSGGGMQNTASQPEVASRNVKIDTDMSGLIRSFVDLALLDKRKQLIDSQVAQNAQAVATARANQSLLEFQLHENLPSEVYARNRATQRADDLHSFNLQSAQLDNFQKALNITLTGLDIGEKTINLSTLAERNELSLSEARSRISQSEAVTKKITEETYGVRTSRQKTYFERKISEELYDRYYSKGIIPTDKATEQVAKGIIQSILNPNKSSGRGSSKSRQKNVSGGIRF